MSIWQKRFKKVSKVVPPFSQNTLYLVVALSQNKDQPSRQASYRRDWFTWACCQNKKAVALLTNEIDFWRIYWQIYWHFVSCMSKISPIRLFDYKSQMSVLILTLVASFEGFFKVRQMAYVAYLCTPKI